MNDGRNIDPSLGVLEGEGSQQAIAGNRVPASHLRPRLHSTPPIPLTTTSRSSSRRYGSGRSRRIFTSGGVAGAAMMLALAGQLFGGRKLREFEERCRWIGAVGGGIGTALLIHDLGRKERFLFMLRVFRPTSPMSIGSWVLAAATPLSAGSAMLTFSHGPLYRAGTGRGHRRGHSRTAAGHLHRGADLEHRRAGLAGGPAHSAAAVRGIVDGRPGIAARPDGTEPSRAPRRATSSAPWARVAELAAGAVMEREVSRVPRVGKPLHEGVAGALWTAAKVATASQPGGLAAARADRAASGSPPVCWARSGPYACASRSFTRDARRRSIRAPPFSSSEPDTGPRRLRVVGQWLLQIDPDRQIPACCH